MSCGAAYAARRLHSGAAAAPKNPLEVLELDPSADETIIKKQHRVLARRYHPDNRETGNEAKFKEIQAAFEQLRDSGYKYRGAAPDGSSSTADPNTPGAKMHYNAPGSTDKNYMEKHPQMQAYVRFVLVWCVCFAATRLFLSTTFDDPDAKRRANEAMARHLESALQGSNSSGRHGGSRAEEPLLHPSFSRMSPHQRSGSASGSTADSDDIFGGMFSQQQQMRQHPSDRGADTADPFSRR